MSDTILDNVVKRFKDSNNVGDDEDVFSLFSLSQVFKQYDYEYSDLEDSIVDGGGDGGFDSIILTIDGNIIKTQAEFMFYLSNNMINNTTRLNIFLTQIKEGSGFKEGVWEKMLSLFMFLYEDTALSYALNKETTEKLDLMKILLDEVLVYSNMINLRINYISKGDTDQLSPGVKAKEQQTINAVKRMTKLKSVSAEYYGASELREIYNTPPETETIIEYDEMLNKNFSSDDDNSFVILVNLNKYCKFITNKESALNEVFFESNIRDYEGDVTVNKGIITSLENENDIDFWALNNGVTILSDEIIPITNKRLKIKNVQIVNGLQTSFCIFNYFSGLEDNSGDEKRCMLVKVIKVTDETFADKIIRSTNSQTKISYADLRSTDSLHRDIENNFLANGLYYNRRKKYYNNLNKPRSEIYSVAETAQYVEAIFFQRPSNARNNPTSLLKDDKNYSRIFDNKLNVNIYRTCCLIFSKTKNTISALTRETDIIQETFDASIKNFIMHLSFIVTALLTNNKFEISSLLSIDLNNINEKICQSAISILIEVLNSQDTKNVISVAKLAKFDSAIKTKLNKMFSSGKK